jgi:hypothetical protein
MSYKVETIQKSTFFTLTKNRHRKSDKVHYRITMHSWPVKWNSVGFNTNLLENFSFKDQVRDIVDPLRNKAGTEGTHWKFRSRDEAEKLYTALMLKFA